MISRILHLEGGSRIGYDGAVIWAREHAHLSRPPGADVGIRPLTPISHSKTPDDGGDSTIVVPGECGNTVARMEKETRSSGPHSVQVELDLVIARPIDEVFGRLTDLSDYARWMPRLGVFIRSGQTSKGPVGVGTTYYDTGWMGTFVGEVAEFHAPTRVAFREKLQWLGMTVMEARPQYELVSTRAGTEVHHRAEGELFGVFNVLKPAVAWMARGERGRTLRALKRSLERER